MLPYLRHTDDGYYLDVYVQPGASKQGLAGTFQNRLKIKVSAQATEGKANLELCQLLARILQVSKSSITLVRGEKARLKTLYIKSISDEALAILQEEMRSQSS